MVPGYYRAIFPKYWTAKSNINRRLRRTSVGCGVAQRLLRRVALRQPQDRFPRPSRTILQSACPDAGDYTQQEDIKPRRNNVRPVKNIYKSNKTSCEKGPKSKLAHCPSPVKDTVFSIKESMTQHMQCQLRENLGYFSEGL